MNKITFPFIRREIKDVVFISDLHVGNMYFDKIGFEERIQKVIDLDCHVIFLGDLIENAFKESLIEGSNMSINEQIKYLISKLKPLKQKILGACIGNHEHRTSKQSNSQFNLHQTICDILEIKNLGIMAIFQFLNEKIIYSGLVKHSNGNAINDGSRLTQIYKMKSIISDLDFYGCGHCHSNLFRDKQRITLENYEPIFKQQLFFYCSHHLDYGGYPLEKGYEPSEQTGFRILRLNKNKFEMKAELI